tara:strand:+ start:5812 stop:6033 length:222 start_codon:yes stop_codon:yes gene_type:complete
LALCDKPSSSIIVFCLSNDFVNCSCASASTDLKDVATLSMALFAVSFQPVARSFVYMDSIASKTVLNEGTFSF